MFNLETSLGWYSANGIVVHNCRCTTAPVLRSARELGGTRASLDGQVPESVKWRDWVARQSAERQDESFGKGAARLFRAGRIELEDLVDGAGSRLSLERLLAIAER